MIGTPTVRVLTLIVTHTIMHFKETIASLLQQNDNVLLCNKIETIQMSMKELKAYSAIEGVKKQMSLNEASRLLSKSYRQVKLNDIFVF